MSVAINFQDGSAQGHALKLNRTHFESPYNTCKNAENSIWRSQSTLLWSKLWIYIDIWRAAYIITAEVSWTCCPGCATTFGFKDWVLLWKVGSSSCYLCNQKDLSCRLQNDIYTYRYDYKYVKRTNIIIIYGKLQADLQKMEEWEEEWNMQVQCPDREPQTDYHWYQ